jgi:hypothetical protein
VTRRQTGISLSPAKKPIVVVALMLALATIAIILYWPTLKLPLLYDDLLHIRIAGELDLATVWLPTEAFGFYRPLTFLPLVLIERLFGHYPAELLHGINVAQHGLNALLVFSLSWRLWHRLRWSLAAGLLFAFFPFSYQAVAVYGHNVHPSTTGLILLALHTYLSARRAERRAFIWWLLTVLLFFLSLLSHESAVLFGAFAALVQWNEDGQLPKPGRSNNLPRQPWLIFLAVGLVYLIVYQFLPISRAPQAVFNGGALWSKFLYLIQALTYPLAWFGSLSPNISAAIVVLVALAFVIALTAWSARQRTNRLPLILGWGWWGLASLVIAVPLSATYLLHGPRLLYLGSVGVALLWPVLLEPIYQLPRAGRLFWLLALGFLLLTSGFFIRDRLDAYTRMTSPVAEVQKALEDRPVSEGILLVNLPQWLTPQRNTYPVGTEIVAMLGDSLFVEELMAQNLRVDRPVAAIRVPDLLDKPNYNYAVHVQLRGDSTDGAWAPDGSHIFITTFAEEGPETSYVGQLNPPLAGASPLATFGPYELLNDEAIHCMDTLRLTTTWRFNSDLATEIELSPTTSLFVQFVTPDGQLVAQADGPLLGLRPDLLGLPVGWLMSDVRELDVEEGLSGRLLIGVYDYATGERYPTLDDRQIPLPDNALPVWVEDCS